MNRKGENRSDGGARVVYNGLLVENWDSYSVYTTCVRHMGSEGSRLKGRQRFAQGLATDQQSFR